MLVRGTWAGLPVYVVASKVLALKETVEENVNMQAGTEILLDSHDKNGDHERTFFSEPVEIVAAALAEALKNGLHRN